MAYNTHQVIFLDGTLARCEIRKQNGVAYILYKKEIWIVEYSETVSVGWNYTSHIYKAIKKAELV